MEFNLDLILVDYLQLMSSGARVENRVQEVSYISRNLKVLAREIGVPVLAAAQLSRAIEQRADKEPQLSDLRESGSLEQDADVVMFIHRPEMYEKDTLKQNQSEKIKKLSSQEAQLVQFEVKVCYSLNPEEYTDMSIGSDIDSTQVFQ